MKNGKIYEFLQKYGLYIICSFGIFVGIAYGIHSCKDAMAIDINARRNVVNINKHK